MSQKVSITLDDEVLEFVDSVTANRSSYINKVLQDDRRKQLFAQLVEAYKDQSSDPELSEELSAWDVVVGDGISDGKDELEADA
ncbi:MAG: hypothetical protein JOZ78_04620 [Chroococcidiopsidaceae cyanobacterium CP_BM_ER_R8_30]|nr:hypothetical protein [Chroococcidiopsidaceae cyanobacterium CP_BM_ER_R8_30]